MTVKLTWTTDYSAVLQFSLYLQCFDKALIKLYCVGGECGVILAGKPHKCPIPCSQYQICAECIKAPWCGWCAFAGYIGEGICMQGGRDNPTGVGSCLENDIKQSEGYRPSKQIGHLHGLIN